MLCSCVRLRARRRRGDKMMVIAYFEDSPGCSSATTSASWACRSARSLRSSRTATGQGHHGDRRRPSVPADAGAVVVAGPWPPTATSSSRRSTTAGRTSRTATRSRGADRAPVDFDEVLDAQRLRDRDRRLEQATRAMKRFIDSGTSAFKGNGVFNRIRELAQAITTASRQPGQHIAPRWSPSTSWSARSPRTPDRAHLHPPGHRCEQPAGRRATQLPQGLRALDPRSRSWRSSRSTTGTRSSTLDGTTKVSGRC